MNRYQNDTKRRARKHHPKIFCVRQVGQELGVTRIGIPGLLKIFLRDRPRYHRVDLPLQTGVSRLLDIKPRKPSAILFREGTAFFPVEILLISKDDWPTD